MFTLQGNINEYLPIVSRIITVREYCVCCGQYTAMDALLVGNELEVLMFDITFDCGNLKCDGRLTHYAVGVMPSNQD